MSLAIDASIVTSLPEMYSSQAWYVSARSAATSVRSSARRKCTTWLSRMLLPKALRSRVYSIVRSMSRSRLRSDEAAPHRRSSWNCSIWNAKPMPSWPITWRCGTRTPSKNSMAVSDESIPTLWIFCFVMPGRFIGTMIRLLFLCTGPSLVLASRQHQSACRPLVIHILLPSMM